MRFKSLAATTLVAPALAFSLLAGIANADAAGQDPSPETGAVKIAGGAYGTLGNVIESVPVAGPALLDVLEPLHTLLASLGLPILSEFADSAVTQYNANQGG